MGLFAPRPKWTELGLVWFSSVQIQFPTTKDNSKFCSRLYPSGQLLKFKRFTSNRVFIFLTPTWETELTGWCWGNISHPLTKNTYTSGIHYACSGCIPLTSNNLCIETLPFVSSSKKENLQQEPFELSRQHSMSFDVTIEHVGILMLMLINISCKCS